MKRRDFLKTTALAGLAVAAPLPFSSIARAEDVGSYEGPLWITINASGGWDPTIVDSIALVPSVRFKAALRRDVTW